MKHKIVDKQKSGGHVVRSVLCVSLKEHLEDAGVKAWLEKEYLGEPKPILAANHVAEVHISQHGVKGVEDEFAGVLKHSPYIRQIIATNYGGKRTHDFICDIPADEVGVIEICMVWASPQCRLRLTTTGENRVQTKRIAEMLRERYGRGH